MDNATLETVDAFDAWPFVVVQDTRSVEKKVAFLLKLSFFAGCRLLTEGDLPFTHVVLPLGSGSFGVECHVLAQVENIADLFEVLLYVWSVREETRPVRVQSEIECVGM